MTQRSPWSGVTLLGYLPTGYVLGLTSGAVPGLAAAAKPGALAVDLKLGGLTDTAHRKHSVASWRNFLCENFGSEG